MLKARTLTVLIKTPVDEVYAFVVNPANLTRWTMIGPGRQIDDGPLTWSFDGPHGEVVVNFTPSNPFYVLDYTIRMGVQITLAASVRLIRNGNGSVLTHTSVQQPLISDAAFASEEEWMRADLLVLKTLLER